MSREPATEELVRLKNLCRKAYLLRAEIEAMGRDEKYQGGYALAAASEEYRQTILRLESEGTNP